ncbi:MAG TPA: hypothetical protein VJW51_04460, partial [Candidatus Acidoferrales bacterium]|nr:hypothetical protein [Candidatus Acidoferrales bacterium]
MTRSIRLAAGLFFLLPISAWAQSAPTTITTFAGGGPNNVPAASANLDFNYSATPDSAGNVYIPDVVRCVVFKVDSTGTLTVFAGQMDQCGFGGDGGPATSGMLNGCSGVAADGSGNVFIADTNNERIRRVDHMTGFITTYAGNGVAGAGGDNGPATSANLNLNPGNFYFNGLALDSAGNLYIADTFNFRVRRVDTSVPPIITTYAGNGTQGFMGDGSAATSAELSDPNGLAFDATTGSLYIADLGNQRVRVVDSALNINTVAGGGTGTCPGATDSLGDGCLATSAVLSNFSGIGVDGMGNLFIADRFNNRIREVDHTSTLISTVGGNGTAGFSGDGGLATSGEVNFPVGLSVDSAGNVFIGDTNNFRVREIYCTNGNIPCTPPAGFAPGDINTFAGNGFRLYSGDGVPAANAALFNPTRVTADAAGDLFITDSANGAGNDVVRRVDARTGIITTIAGTPGVSAYGGDNGPATSAQLVSPLDVALDAAGNVYIADPNACVVRRVDATTKIITTVAGNGSFGFNGDGIPATSAQLATPIGVSFNAAGDLFIADANNNRIRRVD